MSSVLDMAKYDAAIDQGTFLTKETQQLAFTPRFRQKARLCRTGLAGLPKTIRTRGCSGTTVTGRATHRSS